MSHEVSELEMWETVQLPPKLHHDWSEPYETCLIWMPEWPGKDKGKPRPPYHCATCPRCHQRILYHDRNGECQP